MGLLLKGGWIGSGLTARNRKRPSTWAPALFKALFSMSYVYAPNAVSCLLSRLLNIFRETKQANQKPQVGSVCLFPRKKSSVSQLVLHSCMCTHCFTLTTADSACVHQALVGKKPLGNTALYHWKGLKYSYENSCFFIFFAASFIFIFNMAKSFYRNHSISGKEQRRVRLKCSPSRCMLPSQMLFPFFPVPFSFDIAGRLFS